MDTIFANPAQFRQTQFIERLHNLEQNRESQFFIASVVKIAQAIEDAGVAPLLRGLGLYGYQGFATGMPLRIV